MFEVREISDELLRLVPWLDNKEPSNNPEALRANREIIKLFNRTHQDNPIILPDEDKEKK